MRIIARNWRFMLYFCPVWALNRNNCVLFTNFNLTDPQKSCIILISHIRSYYFVCILIENSAYILLLYASYDLMMVMLGSVMTPTLRVETRGFRIFTRGIQDAPLENEIYFDCM